MDRESQAGAAARRLVRGIDRAALATRLAAEAAPGGGSGAGWPYASLVLAAFDLDGTPLLLLSDLAEHCRNIAADPRVALLFDGTAGCADPLAGPRVTILGRAQRTTEPRHRARFLARHPGAALYAGFADFNCYVVAVERAHSVAGFGRIDWIQRTELLLDMSAAGALATVEPEILAHMNADHAEALESIAGRLLGRGAGRAGWRMTGIDPDGIDLRREGEVARADFADRVLDAGAARAELVRLAAAARKAGGQKK